MESRAINRADDFRMALIGALLGAVFFFCVFDYRILNPTNVEWLFSGDSLIHYLGFHFFRFEDWQFPLGKINGYGIPTGSSVVFTDSIPLLAMVMKAFSPLFPESFQYLGPWVLLSYVLQGFFGWRLSSLSTKSSYLCALTTSFFILTPSLLFRTDAHRALTAHWLLLATLYLCLQHTEALISRETPFPRLRAWTAVIVLSVGIHLYFCAMVLVFYAVKCAVHLVTHRYRIVRTVALMSVPLLLALLLLYVEGGFVVKSSHWSPRGATFFGYFSMNLTAPANPALSLVPEKASLQSMFVNPGPLATHGQYEGYNYLGIGFLLLCPTAVIFGVFKACARWKNVGALAERPWLPKALLWPTVSAAVLLTLFAASSKLTWGHTELYTVPLPEKVLAFCEVFRSSGRFFWPVSYLIMWLVFWSWSVLLRQKTIQLAALLHVALALQLVDLSQFIHKYSTLSHSAFVPYHSPLKSTLWPSLMKKYQRIYYYPPSDGTFAKPLGLLAAPYKVGVNAAAPARHDLDADDASRKQVLQELQTGHLRRNSLYIFRDVNLFNVLKTQLEGRAGSVVRELDGLYVAGL
jgi:hypothetical protein